MSPLTPEVSLFNFAFEHYLANSQKRSDFLDFQLSNLKGEPLLFHLDQLYHGISIVTYLERNLCVEALVLAKLENNREMFL